MNNFTDPISAQKSERKKVREQDRINFEKG